MPQPQQAGQRARQALGVNSSSIPCYVSPVDRAIAKGRTKRNDRWTFCGGGTFCRVIEDSRVAQTKISTRMERGFTNCVLFVAQAQPSSSYGATL